MAHPINSQFRLGRGPGEDGTSRFCRPQYSRCGRSVAVAIKKEGICSSAESVEDVRTAGLVPDRTRISNVNAGTQAQRALETTNDSSFVVMATPSQNDVQAVPLAPLGHCKKS